LVHPNNPTGHPTTLAERHQLEAICECHNLALIVDEVFLDYSLETPVQSFATGSHSCLTFVVSGLSKIAALPQMKVGWLMALGPEKLRDQALGRLEMIADTYLSMNAPAQYALPCWLEQAGRIQDQILNRIRENIASLATANPVSLIPVQAGWSAVLQLPQSVGSESLAEQLVEQAGVIVHPGSFYALTGSHRIVVSLLGPAIEFRAGIQKLRAWCESRTSTWDTAP
jgi:aspartate/methionine/tyrosine aminotransferase